MMGFGHMGMGMPGMMGHHGMGAMQEDPDRGLLLNCIASFEDGNGNVANTLAVNIQKPSSSSSMRGHHGMMGGFGFGGLGHYGHMLGQEKHGLRASVELVSNTAGGTGYVVFTTRARPIDGCTAENFGDVLLDHEEHGHGKKVYGGIDPLLALGVVDPFFGAGGFGLGGGYGLGLGLGFGLPVGGLLGGHHHHGHHGSEDQESTVGIVAEIDIVPGAMTTAVIDDIGFHDLEDLAGRGVVICTEVKYDWDWHPTCEEPYFSCCSLKYDDTEASIIAN